MSANPRASRMQGAGWGHVRVPTTPWDPPGPWTGAVVGPLIALFTLFTVLTGTGAGTARDLAIVAGTADLAPAVKFVPGTRTVWLNRATVPVRVRSAAGTDARTWTFDSGVLWPQAVSAPYVFTSSGAYRYTVTPYDAATGQHPAAAKPGLITVAAAPKPKPKPSPSAS